MGKIIKLLISWIMKFLKKSKPEMSVETKKTLPKVVTRERNVLRVPKEYRRDVRAIKNEGLNKNNEGRISPNNHFSFKHIGSPVYLPKRKKLKGWEKNNRRFTKIS